ncbi:ABC transporter permease [Microtetraspora niveoalba]|uniref:ABC transporter permease n=1 Tax=Microtetraspora niveoalba TaxID=46175 RepID=UPI000834B0C7|nr:ABC transporter permease [Microtetraspora niveoalba]
MTIPFHRLLAVETRKLFDTRSAAILTAVLLCVTVAAVAGRGLYAGPDMRRLVWTAGIGYSTILPVLGILTVTNEWSHRTALTTFALEPRRWRVMAAKTIPPAVTAVAASLFAVLVAIPATALTSALRDLPADWNATPAAMAGWTATNTLFVMMGVALGALLLNGPAAIVVYLASTGVWNAVAMLGAAGETAAEWLDLNRTTAPLATGDWAHADLSRIAVSAALWIVIPLLLGVARVSRKEVK